MASSSERPPTVSGMRWPDEDSHATPSPMRCRPRAGDSLSTAQERVEVRRVEAAARHLSRSRAARQQRSPIVHPNAPLPTTGAALLLDDEETAAVTSSKEAARQSHGLLVDQVAKLKQEKRALRVMLDDEMRKLQEEEEHVDELEEELTKMRGAVRARESQYAGTTWKMANEMTSLRAQLAAANDKRLSSTSTLEFEKAELQAQKQELEIQYHKWKLRAAQATFRGVARLDAALLRSAWDAWFEWWRFRHEQQRLMRATQRELQSGKARIEALESEIISLRQQLLRQERLLEQYQQDRTRSTERNRASLEVLAGHMIKRLQNRTAVSTLVQWRAYASFSRRAKVAARRIVFQMRSRAALVVLDAWRYWTSESTQRNRLMSKLFLRKTHRQLTSVLTSWHMCAASAARNRTVGAHMAGRRCRSMLMAALRMWRTHVTNFRSHRLLTARLLYRMQRICVASALDVWMRWATRATHYRVVVDTQLRRWKLDSLGKVGLAFACWKSRSITRRQHARAAARFTTVLAHGRVALVWRSWSAQAKRSLKSRRLMQRFLCVLRNSRLALVYRTWQTAVAEMRIGKARSIRAEHMLTRKHKKTAAVVISSWRAHVTFVKRSVMLTQRALAKMMSDVLLETLEAWADWTAERMHFRVVVQKARHHKLRATAASGFASWQGWAVQRRALQRIVVKGTAHFAMFQTRRVWCAWSRLSKEWTTKNTKQRRVQMVLARSKLVAAWHIWQAFVAATTRICRLITRVDGRRLSRMVATTFMFWHDFTAQSLEQMLQHEEEELKIKKVHALEDQLATSEACCAGLQKKLSTQEEATQKKLNALENHVASEEAACAELRSQLSEQDAAYSRELADVRKQRADALLRIQSAQAKDKARDRLEQELSALKEALQTVSTELLHMQTEHKRVTQSYHSEVAAAVASCMDEVVAKVVNAQNKTNVPTERDAERKTERERGRPRQTATEPSMNAEINQVSPRLIASAEKHSPPVVVETPVETQVGASSSREVHRAAERQREAQAETQGQSKHMERNTYTDAFEDGAAELARIRKQLAELANVQASAATQAETQAEPQAGVLLSAQMNAPLKFNSAKLAHSHSAFGSRSQVGAAERLFTPHNRTPCAGEAIIALPAADTHMQQQQLWSRTRMPVAATWTTGDALANTAAAARRTAHQLMDTRDDQRPLTPPTSSLDWYSLNQLKQMRPPRRRASP